MVVEKEIEFMVEQRPELKDILNGSRRVMRRLNLEILVPLTLGGKILGAVAFGKKKNGELYTSDNIKTLKGFSEQLSVALASVQNYENTLKFIQNDLT